MSTPIKRGAIALRTLLVLNLFTAVPLYADLWYQHYQRAEDALEAERWEEAVDQLNQAIQRNRTMQ